MIHLLSKPTNLNPLVDLDLIKVDFTMVLAASGANTLNLEVITIDGNVTVNYVIKHETAVMMTTKRQGLAVIMYNALLLGASLTYEYAVVAESINTVRSKPSLHNSYASIKEAEDAWNDPIWDTYRSEFTEPGSVAICVTGDNYCIILHAKCIGYRKQRGEFIKFLV